MFEQFQCDLPSFNCILGQHCCLWCTITGRQMQEPRKIRSQFPSRTLLESLQADYESFQQAGLDIKNAKYHNNVTGKCMLDVPIHQVIYILYIYIYDFQFQTTVQYTIY